MKTYFTDLFAYEYWANKQVLNAFLQVGDPPERAALLMSHLLNAQQIWYARLTQQPETKVWDLIPAHQLVSTLDTQARHLQAYVARLSETDFPQPIVYTNSRGETFQNSVQQILTHLQLHSAYHRGQIVQLLKPFLATLPVTDYIFYIRAQ